MKTTLRTLTLLATVSLAPVAGAQPPMGPPKPSPELKDFGAWFVGTWKCESSWNASPFGPAHKAKATVPIKWAEGGFWIMSNYKEQKTKENPMPFEVTEWFGHDGKKFQYHAFDNFGGAVMGSGAFEGDKLSISGEAVLIGMKGPHSIVFTKKSPKELTFAVSLPGPDGKLLEMGGGTCKK